MIDKKDLDQSKELRQIGCSKKASKRNEATSSTWTSLNVSKSLRKKSELEIQILFCSKKI